MDEQRTNDHMRARRDLFLIVTRFCNLNCKYCYESHRSNKHMTFDVARSVLEAEFDGADHPSGTATLRIQFMGGEPLHRFDLIKEVAEWIWSEPRPLPYSLFIRTNGTLLTDEMKAWFTENNERIAVGLSFDGIPAMHAINRSGKAIDVEFFTTTWPEQEIQMTLFKDSVHLLDEAVRELHERHVPFTVSIGEGFEWDEKSAAVFESELSRVADYYLRHSDLSPAPGLFSMAFESFFPEASFEWKFCGTGSNFAAYDIDGERYLCHLLSPVAIGEETAKTFREMQDTITTLPLDSSCHDCPIRSTCQNCCGFNLKIHGDIEKPAARTTLCRVRRIQAKIGSLFFLKKQQEKIENGEHLSPREWNDAQVALRLLKHFTT